MQAIYPQREAWAGIPAGHVQRLLAAWEREGRNALNSFSATSVNLRLQLREEAPQLFDAQRRQLARL